MSLIAAWHANNVLEGKSRQEHASCPGLANLTVLAVKRCLIVCVGVMCRDITMLCQDRVSVLPAYDHMVVCLERRKPV